MGTDIEPSLGDYSWWVRPWAANGLRGPWSQMGRVNIGGKATILSATQSSGTEREFCLDGCSGGEPLRSACRACRCGVIILETGLTQPSYQSTVAMPRGQYRVWVRAIDSRDNVSGIWSNRYDFSISSVDPEDDVERICLRLVNMLLSLLL